MIVSNATLQWVPDHRALLPGLAQQPHRRRLAGVPGAGQLRRAEPHPAPRTRGRTSVPPHLTGIAWPDAEAAETYLDDLARLGCRVEGWETTYLHVLEGPDPVFRWISGTGARPVLNALPDPVRAEFEGEYQSRLREAYPAQSYGTVLPFRRIFVVAHKEAHR